jgi:NAD(P)-dependent dehydrogenase (short-subunit alcohol dehydrogenase family)
MDGRIVIVTGGAGAVGSVVSSRWLAEGAKVLVVDHRQVTIDRWLAQLPANTENSRVATLAADVSDEEGARQIVDTASLRFGATADTLIHLVGGFGMSKVEGDGAVATWNRMMSINVASAFHCYRAMLPSLRARGGGWIVGLTSRAADNPGPGISAYAASKAALGALTS